ncbi:MAG: hypothetical protein ACTHMS_04905 [Jatrophihabitans sp.]|uniref:hypothetical protein n=1 Tax=Jatrophihabitans sp. TaxID=1932789 RepID=UPI003F7DAABD
MVLFADDDLADDQLEQPGVPRRWVALGLLVAVLVAAGAVVLQTRSAIPGHGSGRRPAAAASVPVEQACRAAPDCTVFDSAPVAVTGLAREKLGRDVLLQVHSAVAHSSGRPLLIDRSIDAFANSATVLIRVDLGGSGEQPIAPDPPGVGSLLIHERNAGFVVRLQYLAPETVPPDLTALRALMRDPRLLAV